MQENTLTEINVSTMKIWDGGAAAKAEKKQHKGWNGFHLLFTAQARRSAVLSSLLLWMVLGFIVGTAAAAVGGAGAAGVIPGLMIAVIIYFGFRNDVYRKLYAPDRDCGKLYLPQGMTWDDAIQRIYQGFAHPDVDQLSNTPESITFHSQKYGTYQLLNTADGLKMNILTKPSRSAKKEYLYNVFSSMLFSQVIALLYPQLISAAQVEEEKTAVKKLFKAHKLPLLIELVCTAVFVAFAAFTFYNLFFSASAKSKGISDSTLNIFSADATVGEICDAFFGKSEWDNFEQGGVTYVTCTGYGVNTETNEKIRFVIYFEDDGDTFGIDHITWDGENMNVFEMLAFLQVLDDNYLQEHGLPTSDGSTLDDALNELDQALNEAFADSTTSEPESEAESEPESTAESYPEVYESSGSSDWIGNDPGSRQDEWVVGTNGMDTHSVLASEISSDVNSYEFGEMQESTKEYYLSYGSQFKAAWLNAMYTDVYEESGKYGNLVAWESYTKYIAFYGEAIDYSDAWDLPMEFYNVYYSFDADGATDEDTAPYIDQIIQIAEKYGAELQEF